MNNIENIIPTVIESGARGERAFDIFSLLLKEQTKSEGRAILLFPKQCLHLRGSYFPSKELSWIPRIAGTQR